MASALIRRTLAQYFQRVHVRSFSSKPASYNEPKKGDRVVIGMSGGVDSSVAARLLADQDYDLSAVFMRNWDTRDESGTDKGCEWEKDWEDVQQVCKVLDLPCEMIDLSQQYWNRVFEPSLHQWEMGITPNPDVWCNKEIKFGALLEHLPVSSSKSSKTFFATGHYARKAWSSSFSLSRPPRPKLLRGLDPLKDQSFYLSSISEEGLRRALFPLGELTKKEVRELAKQYDLPTAERAESMGLCFVGEKTRFSRFISEYLPPKPGPIVDMTTGRRVSKHAGLWSFTIGENARVGGMPQKLFVARKDPSQNIIYVVPGKDHPSLYSSGIQIQNFAWIWADTPPLPIFTEEGFRARVKHRHRMESVLCTVRSPDKDPHGLLIEFDELEQGVAAGQVAALWDAEGDWVLGCGMIKSLSEQLD
ncbi:tRNA-specific 2-thiouridylase MnmA [Hypsizygus marmoreus]|uniref:tRNA-5-taurinomethyluridine 2-sulfurtransferase n=1 Tax=Hypsizygus marmoreus TaxID=39966 RepID=A0A369JLV4_HYPMA|nr:tRNA-specific 2-thiouridylase MnmA [Hypsizygus marmoreus]